LLNGTPVKLVEKVVQFASTSTLHRKSKKSKAPMVVSEVRRSDRLKAITRGFEAIIMKRLTASAALLNSLGTCFCKIKHGALSEEALQNKPKKAVRKISRAPTVSKNVKDVTRKKEKK
jgi:hypothetical protein